MDDITTKEKAVLANQMYACSAIAQNFKAYNALKTDAEKHASMEAILSNLKWIRKFFNTPFFMSKSTADAIRTMEVFAYLVSISVDENNVINFLTKNFRSVYEEVIKRKCIMPDRCEYFDPVNHAVEVIMERFALFEMMSGIVMGSHPEFADAKNQKASDEIQLLEESIIASFEPPEKITGNISGDEKYVRNMIADGQEGRPLLSYLNRCERFVVSGVADRFYLNGVCDFKFDRKKLNELARCVCESMSFYVNAQKIIIDDVPITYENFADVTERSLGKQDLNKLAEAFSDVDLNYARIFFAAAMAVKKDREEVADMFIETFAARVPEKKGSKESREARLIKEKDSLIEKKQSELNRMQMEMDRLKKKEAELKSKYNEANSTIKELQKVIEDITSPDTKIDELESDEDYEFPENTVLFGGHPNWISKFKLKYSNVKVYGADDMSFSADVIRNADLVLLNVTYMSHKQFYAVIRQARKHHKKLEYIK